MQKELDHFLVKRFPDFFKNRYSSPMESCMSWGFECDDGWFNILNQACFLVANHIANIKSNNETRLQMKQDIEAGKEVYAIWKTEYEKNGLAPREVPDFVASQIKEKFGTLRFYYQGGDEFIDGVISSAESASCNTCEVCGNIGKLREGGWMKTLCDKHAQEQNRMDEDENEPIVVGTTVYALTNGEMKNMVVKEVLEDKWVAKVRTSKYDKETKEYKTLESEENYFITYVKTPQINYYDAVLEK